MANKTHHSNLQLAITNKQILKIALPISFAVLVPQFNFITNNIFLGHYSQEALATASITGVYYLIFAMIGFGLNNGLQTMIARRAGENKPEEIGKLFGQSVFISFAIAIIGILLTWFLAPVILRNVLNSGSIANDSIEFLKIRIWGLPFLYVYQMRNALLVGTNNSRLLISGAIAETIANICFDYLFIFGNYGFPEMGLNGAAVASIIAEFTGMLVVFLVIHKKGIGRQFSLFNHFYWNKKLSHQLFSISMPIIFQLAFSVISWEFFYILIEHHGQQDLAISNVMRNVFGLTGCLTWAFAATSAAMVSNIIGQGQQDKVRILITKIVKLSTGAALIMAAFINLFPELIISVFGQSDIFINAAIPVVRVVSIAMVVMSFSVVWLNAVIGTGNSKTTLLIESVSILLYSVFVYLILEKYDLSITFGWMGEWIYWGSNFLLSFWYLSKGNWKDKKI